MADPSIPGLWRNLSELEQLVFQLSKRVEALEARPEVQELPTTPQEGGPTLLAPIQLQQWAEPAAGGLLDVVKKVIDNHCIVADCAAARAAIYAVAEWLEDQKVGAALAASRWLCEEVERG